MKKLPSLPAFLEAVLSGNLAALARLAKENPELIHDARPIVHAALHGKVLATEWLLKKGADPNAQVASHEYYRPLHRAIEHRGVEKNDGHAEVVKILFKANADPTLRATWMSLTAPAVAGMAGDEELIAVVLKHKAPIDFFTSIVLADEAAVISALKKNPTCATEKDSNQLTPLHYAALSGLKSPAAQKRLASIAEKLCDAGADMNAREQIGPYPHTPVLHFAGWGNNIAVAEVLLKRGANPNFGFGNTLWREPKELAELFLKHGADVNGRGPDGQPILNLRVHWNLVSVVEWLLKNGADPNLADKKGNTALHEAARRGTGEKMLQALLTHGAKVSAKNKDGETPEQLAKKLKKTKFLELLKKLA